MAHETLGYAVVCTDAYVLNVHASNVEKTTSCFDIALPCGDHHLEHKQPVLVCRLQYRSITRLAHIACGIYHIRAKVRTWLHVLFMK